MDISFIVPVYNVEKYLEECIQSILKQEFYNYEIILINDGSTDSSAKICRNYASKYNNIIYIEQSNKGQSVARNRGISIAKGAYLFFVDSDDKLNHIAWNNILNLFKSTRIDILGFDAVRGDEAGTTVLEKISSFNVSQKLIISGENLIEKYGYKKIQPMPWLYLYRKNFLIQNNIIFHEGCFHEDCEFTLKAICMADKIQYMKQELYFQRISPNSTMRGRNVKKAYDLVLVSNEIFEFVKKLDCSKRVKEELFKYVAYLNWAAICSCEKQGGDIRDLIENNPTIAAALKYSEKYLIILSFIKYKFYRGIKFIVKLGVSDLK